MDRLRTKHLGVTMLQLFLEDIVETNQPGVMTCAHPLYNGNVLRNEVEHLAPERIARFIHRNVERCQKCDRATQPILGCREQILVYLFEQTRSNWVFHIAKHAVKIIDADLDRQSIRSVRKHIVIPPFLEMCYPVSADSFC